MARFVADASATLSWFFEDETTSWTENLLERVKSGDSFVVPAHWLVEVANGFLVAERRKRITRKRTDEFLDAIAGLRIEVEPALTPARAKVLLKLSQKYNLTVYDAAYLDLARRQGLPMATLDRDLRQAASAEGLLLL